MRYTDARLENRWRTAVVLFLAVGILGFAAQWVQSGIESSAPHHGSSVSSAGHAVTVAPEHPHLSDGSNTLPDAIATAVMPRGGVVLTALGAFIGAATLGTRWRAQERAPSRGPPRSAAVISTGRETLSRLCISRR